MTNPVNDGTTITFDNTGYTIPQNAFSGNPDLLSVISQCLGIDKNAFNACASGYSFSFPIATTIATAVFSACTSGTSFSFPLVVDFGGSTGNDSVFDNITGNIISVTAKTIHQTSNGGGMEGDLAYLDANNTVTFNWV